MAIICSHDKMLIERCVDLFGGQDAVKQIADIIGVEKRINHNGDVLIIDLKCVDENTLPDIAIPAVALATIPSYDQAVRLLQRGVRGYGNRHMHRDNLSQAINAVRQGQVWLPPNIISRMIAVIPQNGNGADRPQYAEKLSKREEEVVQCVVSGLSNKEIADKLFISVRTVKAHLTSIFGKTGYRDRLELAVKMKQH